MIERLFKSTYKIGLDMQFERFIESNLERVVTLTFAYCLNKKKSPHTRVEENIFLILVTANKSGIGI